MAKITYADKIQGSNPAATGIAGAADLNEIKGSVNTLYDNLDQTAGDIRSEFVAADHGNAVAVRQSDDVPAQGTPPNIITVGPTIGTYVGDVQVAAGLGAVTPVAPTFGAGSLVITGPNSPVFYSGDDITFTFPAVAGGAPAPAITRRVTIDSTNTYDVPSGAFKIPSGFAGKTLEVSVMLDNGVSPSAILTSTVTIANPALTFPTFLASQITISEILSAPYGRIQCVIGSTPALDSGFDYFLTTPTVDALWTDSDRDWNVANRDTSGNLITAGATLVRPRKPAGLVYPVVYAVHKGTGAYSRLYAYGAFTIAATGQPVSDFPAITHTASSSVMASDTAFRAWIDGLPAGAVGGIPGGATPRRAVWSTTSPFVGKNPAIRLVPTDRDNPPRFTEPLSFTAPYQFLVHATDPANNPARNHGSTGGIIFDGLVFDLSAKKVANAAATAIGGRAFAYGYEPQGVAMMMDRVLWVRCKFIDMYDCIHLFGAHNGISNCEFIGTDCDNIFCYYGGGPYYIGHNYFHDLKRGPNNTEHSDGTQTTMMPYCAQGIQGMVFEYNHFRMNDWPVLGYTDQYWQGFYFDNETISGSASGTRYAGRDYWHTNLLFKGNRIMNHTVYGCAARGWKNVQIQMNLTEGLENPAYTAGTAPCYTGVAGRAGSYNVAHYGSGDISNNVAADALELSSWKMPNVVAGVGFTKSNNKTGNWNKTTRKNFKALANNPISTTNGQQTVVISDTGHGYAVGNQVYLAGATTVGGLSVNGDRIITAVTANTFTINMGANASSTATGGGAGVTRTARPVGWVEGKAGNLAGPVLDFPIPTVPTS